MGVLAKRSILDRRHDPRDGDALMAEVLLLMQEAGMIPRGATAEAEFARLWHVASSRQWARELLLGRGVALDIDVERALPASATRAESEDFRFGFSAQTRQWRSSP